MSTSRITSRQNARVKNAVRLRIGRERERQSRLIIDGAREILRAIECGVRPLEAFISEGPACTTSMAPVLERLQGAGAELITVSPAVFEKLCFGERDQFGVVVVAETPLRRLENLQLPGSPLVAVVEGVEKPGNLGAILRSADAAGVDAVVWADGRTDLFNPNVIRASLGTVFGKQVAAATTPDTIAWLLQQNLRIIAARPDANELYTSADFCGRIAMVLGSEAAGLSQAWHGTTINPVRLPMRGIADSLNVSTTAAVLFYEALRQRSGPAIS